MAKKKTKKPVKTKARVLAPKPKKKKPAKIVKKIKSVKKTKPVKKQKILLKKKTVIARRQKPTKQSKSKKTRTGLRLLRSARNDAKNVKTSDRPIGEFPAEALFKARIKVIGIGGGGGSIVSEIGRSLDKASFVVADTDTRSLKKRPGIKYFLFGQEQTHGLGTGLNIDLAKSAAESAKEKISANFKDQDIIIFIASLGGGLGSGATQVFAEAAKDFGGITFGIFTLPFKFEGKNKQRIALNALKELRESLNVSLVLPNEKIFKIIDANTAITDAFSIVNKSLIESLESLIDLIYSPGVINIDFADLRAILKGRGNSAFLNTVEESGKDRAEKICQKILSNPLLQNSNFTAHKILFNIAGSENLSMFEVEKISNHISAANLKSKIIFGISKSSKLKNKIKTTILMTGGQAQAKEEMPAPAKVEAAPAIEPKKEKSKKKAEKKPAKPRLKKEKAPVPAATEAKTPVFVPALEVPMPAVAEPRRITIPAQMVSESSHKTIRRSALDIKKAEELQEKKRLDQEKEWEIPAFLRRVKYNK